MTTQTETPVRPLSILDPLTDATKQALEPLRIARDEYLEIWMEGDGKYFGLKPTCSREIHEEDAAHYHPSMIRRDISGRLFVGTSRLPGNVSKEAIKRFPESKPLWHDKRFRIGSNDRFGEWRVEKTDTVALMIHHLWPRDRLIFRSETAQLEYRVLVRRFFAQNVRAVMQAEFKLDGKLPEMPRGFVDNDDLPLSPYQKAAVAFTVGHEGTGLFMEQGTGKTPTAISVVCTEARQARAGLNGDPRMTRVLIACPKQVRLNWTKEFERFATAPGKVTVIRGGQMRRIRTLTQAIASEDDCAFSAVIISVDTAAIDWEILAKIPWDRVILDESQGIKGPKTKRTKNFHKLRDSIDRRLVMTGTPIANGPFDLWGQLEFAGEGLSGFTSRESFKVFYGRYKQSVADAAGNSMKRLVGYKNIPLLQERLARIAFSITQEEAGLELPETVNDWREVEMTTEQTKIYKMMAQQLAVEIEEQIANATVTKAISADHILTKLLRLAQITSGYVKWDATFDEDGVCITPPKTEQINPNKNPKVLELMAMLREDAESQPNSKMVVWACFVEDIRAISEALTTEGIKHATYYGSTSDAERDQIYHDFNHDPELKVIICNPGAAGTGLNLMGYDYDTVGEPELDTYVGHVVHFSRNWSYLDWDQSRKRTARRGQRMPIRETDLVVAGTLDEEIRDRVALKQKVALSIQDVRDILVSILEYEDN